MSACPDVFVRMSQPAEDLRYDASGFQKEDHLSSLSFIYYLVSGICEPGCKACVCVPSVNSTICKKPSWQLIS